MKRRILFALLVLCMVISILPGAVSAETTEVASGTCGENLTWVLDSEGTLTISGTGEMYDYPYEKAPWYSYRDVITEVTICDGATTIGEYAFYNCSKMTRINLPNTINSIGDAAFCGSGLWSIRIPASVTFIGEGVFESSYDLTYIIVDEGNLNYSNDEFGVLFNVDKTRLVAFPKGHSGAYTIPDGVTSLSANAFSSSPMLTGITIPGSVTEIGANMFMNCFALEYVELGEGIECISRGAFFSCNALRAVTIPASVTTVETEAFACCENLSDIYFHGNAPEIGTGAFTLVDAHAYRPMNNATWTEDVMLDYGGDITWDYFVPNAIDSGSCGDNLSWALNDAGKLIIWGTGTMKDYRNVIDYSVPYAAPWTPYADQIAEIEVREGVTSIGDYAFMMCNMESVTLPEGLIQIGTYAFYGCTSLTEIDLPESLETIEDVAFGVTVLKNIHIPAATTYIGYGIADGNTVLKGIWVDSYNPNYSSDEYGVLFNKDKTYLHFCRKGIEGAYTIPNTVTELGPQVFDRCIKLTELTIPGSIKDTGYNTFPQCKELVTLELCEGIEIIGDCSFQMCDKLTSVTIPATVTKMGSSVFFFGGLTDIRFKGDAPIFDESTFSAETLTAYYPMGNETWTADVLQNYGGTVTWVSYDPAEVVGIGKCGDNISWVLTFDGTLTVSGEGAIEYISSGKYPWAEYAEQIRKVIFENGVTNVPDYAFDFYPNLESAELKSVEIIGYCAFDGCDSLTSVTLPETLTEIRGGAFSQTGFTAIELPNSLTSIGTGVFSNSSLISIVLPEGLLTVGWEAFYNCTDLKSVVLPNSVTEFGLNVFGRCTSLETVNIPTGVTILPDMLFYGCTNLKNIVIPDSITTISATAFAYTGLTSVTIPASVTTIRTSFIDCTNLTEIIFEGDAPEMYESFGGVTATAYYPLGNETWTSDVMQDYGGDITWVGYAPHEGAVEFIGASLSLKGDIGLNYYYMLSDEIRADSTAYMSFTGLQEPKTVSMGAGVYDPSDGSYGFTVALNAKNMGDRVTAQAHNAFGPVGEAKTISIKTYADYAIANSSDAALVKLMKAMLNYGAAAQVEFGYNTGALVNADMSAADQALPGAVDVSAYASSLTGKEDGITLTTASLLLQSEAKIRVYFELAAGKSIRDYVFTVDGKTVTPVLSESGEYYIEKTNVAAKDLDTMYTFRLGGLTLNYCGLSYVNQVQKYSSNDVNLMNLAKSLYCYNQAANAFFG